VPGFGNKALTQLPRIAPRGVITRMLARIQDI